MTSDIIANKADFQRHLNGCEQRVNDLTKSLQNIEKLSQRLLLNKSPEDQDIYFKQLNVINSQIEFLYLSISTLNQSSFASNGRKRLDLCKHNLDKNRLKFQQIQQYAQIKFGYEYEEEEEEEQSNNEEQEQSMKLLEKNTHDKQNELDRIHQQTIIVSHLGEDIDILHDTFIDLNRLVHEQGTIVDNIELELTKTDEMVLQGAGNVAAAVQTKKRTKRLKWILISIFICVLLVLIIIIFFTVKLSPYG